MTQKTYEEDVVFTTGPAKLGGTGAGGTIYQFLTINQLKIQITESFKSLSPQFNGATCQEVSTKAFETSQKCPLYNKIGTWRRNCCQKWVGGLGPFGPALIM